MSSTDPTARSAQRLMAMVSIAAALLLVAAWAAPHLELPSTPAGALVFGSVALVVMGASWAAPGLRNGSWSGLKWAGAPLALLAGAAAFQSSLPGLPFAVLVLTGLLGAGAIIGGAVGSQVESPGYLLLIAWIAAIVDIGSVFAPSGPTAQIIEHAETILPLVAVSWPMAGTSDLAPVLGVGDITMSALLVQAARSTSLSVPRALLGLGAGYAATFVLLLLAGRAIPALPMLGAGVVLALLPHSVRVPREDRLKGFGFALVITVLSVGAVWMRL